jgi:hypothetical protein
VTIGEGAGSGAGSEGEGEGEGVCGVGVLPTGSSPSAARETWADTVKGSDPGAEYGLVDARALSEPRQSATVSANTVARTDARLNELARAFTVSQTLPAGTIDCMRIP